MIHFHTDLADAFLLCTNSELLKLPFICKCCASSLLVLRLLWAHDQKRCWFSSYNSGKKFDINEPLVIKPTDSNSVLIQ